MIWKRYFLSFRRSGYLVFEPPAPLFPSDSRRQLFADWRVRGRYCNMNISIHMDCILSSKHSIAFELFVPEWGNDQCGKNPITSSRFRYKSGCGVCHWYSNSASNMTEYVHITPTRYSFAILPRQEMFSLFFLIMSPRYHHTLGAKRELMSNGPATSANLLRN